MPTKTLFASSEIAGFGDDVAIANEECLLAGLLFSEAVRKLEKVTGGRLNFDKQKTLRPRPGFTPTEWALLRRTGYPQNYDATLYAVLLGGITGFGWK